MDYEKKYNEAIKRAKQHCADYVVETIFPELKESEDERIRKALIKYYSFDKDGGSHALDNITPKQIVTWLEKQGEQQGVSIQINPSEYINDMGGNGCYLKNDTQKPAENKGMNIVEEDMTPFQKKVFCIIDTAIEEEQGFKQVCDELLRLAHDDIMQKPAWSEEDDEHLERILKELENQRQRPLNSPYLDKIESDYNWLKSLKDRYTWKPSDEQMQALSNAGNSFRPFEESHKVLWSLYNDLKKLREE